MLRLHIDWKKVLASLDLWLDSLMKDWSERGILWKYQCIKISLETLREDQRKVFEEIQDFDRRLRKRSGGILCS
jgi:hypothetical protein